MDDFGSGYSLKKKKKDSDIVKLDGTFFSSETMNKGKENIIDKK